MNLYHTLFESYITYGITLWGPKTYLLNIQLLGDAENWVENNLKNVSSLKLKAKYRILLWLYI